MTAGPSSSEKNAASELPSDPVGVRPAGESSCGILDLLWLTLVEIRCHLKRILVISFYAGCLYLAACLLLGCLGSLLFKGTPSWWTELMIPLSLLIGVPVTFGYSYALLLVVQRQKPKAREVFRPFESLALYVNVLVAGGLGCLGAWATNLVLGLIPVGIPEAMLPEDPLSRTFVQSLPGAVVGLLWGLPFVFAGIDAVVTRDRFGRCLARSVGFARRHGRLFAGFVVISAAESLIGYWLSALQKTHSAGLGDAHYSGDIALPWLAFALIVAMLVIGALVFVLYYREFVWREREAGATPPAAPAAPPQGA